MRILSGAKPTGDQLHIGNYLGAIKQWVTAQNTNNTDEYFFFIPNLHALTTVKDGPTLREQTLGVAMQYLALGLDPNKSVIWVQSDVPYHTELTWVFSCLTPMGLLERAHAYKDAVTKAKEINVGVFTYPILMSIDIIMYQANLVPVGKDQKQHVEIARDLAQRFNYHYGETFTLPDPLIPETVATIPGTDGEKMSKSYGNTIGLFEPESHIKKKIMSIVTDSKTIHEPKDPDTCNVFQLLKHFAPEDLLTPVRIKYLEGGIGYGDVKKLLFECFMTELLPMRTHFETLKQKPNQVKEILALGAEKAAIIALPTVEKVRKLVGY